MSMDILAATGGRLASLAKNTSSLQNKLAGDATSDQDKADPAKLFGALLEKPQVKEADKADQTEGRDAQESDATAVDPSRQSSAYIVQQNLLSLTANLQAAKNDAAALPVGGNSDGKASLAPLMDAVAQEKGGEARLASDLSALLPDAAKKPTEAFSTDKKKAAGGDKSASKPEASLAAKTQAADSPAASEPKNIADDHAAVKQPVESGNLPDRMGLQPQQPASRGNVSVEAKAQTPAAQNLVRIDDIQIISERSSGTVKTLQIRLDPVELGSVTARIRIVSDNIEVHLVADKPHAAEALAADRSMIEKALKVAGINEDAKISVTVTERGAVSLQQSTSSQSAGQQQAGAQQQGQQGFGMQSGADGRNGSQGQSQAQFMSGEGRQNGESGQAGRGTSENRASSSAAPNENPGSGSVRNRGLVV